MKPRRVSAELRVVAAALNRCVDKYPRGTSERVVLWWMAMNVTRDLSLLSELTPAQVAQFRRAALDGLTDA